MNPSPETPGGAVRRFFGWALVAVGALWAGLCGLCTLVIIGNTLFTKDFGGMGLLSLLIGGVGAAPGLGLFFIGRLLLKPRMAPKPPR